jgi:hypothetical protein
VRQLLVLMLSLAAKLTLKGGAMQEIYEQQCEHKKQEVTFLKNKELNETKAVRATCVDCKQDLDCLSKKTG